MLRIGEAYYPGEEDVPMFGLGLTPAVHDPKVVDVAFKTEPSVEVNELFGLDGG